MAYAQTQPPQFTISTVAGNGTTGYSGDGGQALNASLDSPVGLFIDAAGNIYFADENNNRIRKIAPNGVITTIAGTGAAGFSGDGGQATAATLNGPNHVAMDPAGEVVFTDVGNNRIRKIAADGIISTIAGGASGYCGDGGPAIKACLNRPWDVVYDSNGNLFIPDSLNSVVRKVDTKGIITTVAGNGVQGFSGDNGPATAASLNAPACVSLDASGNLFIADGPHIRRVSQGVINTIAGTGTAGATGDGGVALSAEIRAGCLRLDSQENVFFSDATDSRVRVILANGNVFTIAGNGTSGSSGDGGLATSATLDPNSLQFSASGSIYVSDASHERIRLLTPVLQPPTINMGGIVPVYSSSNTIQPGEWVSIFGTNLAAQTTIWNGDFPTKLGGTTVTVDGKAAYLEVVSPGQINFQAPDDANTGPVNVVVTTAGGSATATVRLGPYAPSFLLLSARYPTAIVQTSGPGNSGGGYDIIGPSGAFPYASRPVNPGEIVVIYAVGFGPTSSPVPAGQLYSGAAPCVTTPQITIGGVQAQVDFAGIVEAGLYQFNVVVPNLPSGDQLLVGGISGMSTQPNIFLTIQ